MEIDKELDTPNRRYLLKLLAIGIPSLILSPKDLFSKIEIIKDHKRINLEITIDKLEKDFLNKDYNFNKEGSIIYQALEKTKNFYSDLGKEYGFPGIEIQIVQNSQNESFEKRNFKFRYTSREKFSDEFKWHRKDLKKVEGISDPNINEIYLFSSKYFNRLFKKEKQGSSQTPLSNYISLILNHELGHLFGLEHVDFKLRDNLMLPGMKKSQHEEKRLNQKQIKQIYKYLGERKIKW